LSVFQKIIYYSLNIFQGSNKIPPFQSQINRLYQFNEFFQGLYTDLFSDSDRTCIQNIQQCVIELLTIYPNLDFSERRNFPQEQARSKRSLELLAHLIPFPLTVKKQTKKKHIESMSYKNKFEEVKGYYLANSPVANFKPLIHKINWESSSGAALLTILASKRRFPDGLLELLSQSTGISENTLKWKRRQLLDENIQRSIQSMIEHKRKPKIPPNLKKKLIVELIERLPTLPRLQSLQKFCVTFLQRPENLIEFLRFQNPDFTEDQIQKQLDYYLSDSPLSQQSLKNLFHASYNWIIQFLDEEGISFYAPLSPVNRIDQTYARIFISKVSDAMKKVGKALVLNLDETSVKISMSPQRTLNFKKTDQRVRTNVRSSKACFTAVGIIGADGTRYDPLIIAKGTTKDCGRVIDKLIQEGLPIHRKLFSKNGWMTGVTMLDVLDYVGEIRDSIKPGSKIYLVLDVFRAHLCEDVLKKAKKLRIKFITVPANGTGIYQPLDVLIFGILKQYLRQSYRDWLEHLDPSSDIHVAVEDGIRRFLEAWERITKQQILAAWDKIPQLMEEYKSKKRNLDDIYADIDQINKIIDKDFIDINVIKLSNIVKTESDIYRDVGLFHYDLMKNDDDTIRIESGSTNLSSLTHYQMDNQFNNVMSDENLIDIQSKINDIYDEIEEIYSEYEGRNHLEEEDDSENKEQFRNVGGRDLRNVHYNFAEMDSSSDDDDLYQPKKRDSRKKVIQCFPNDDSGTEPIFPSKREFKYVFLSSYQPQCIMNQSGFCYKGYFNLGNTCYMNSCLIVLYHFFEFRDFLDSVVLQESDNLKNSFIFNLQEMFQALPEFNDYLRETQTQFCEFLDSSDSFSSIFYQDSTQVSFANSQNDASQFFEYVLNQIEEEVKAINRKDCIQDLLNLMFISTSKVNNFFSGPIETISMIPLGISSGSTDLLDCIEDYFDDKFQIKNEDCIEDCFERLIETPYLFIFMLKRYSYFNGQTYKNKSSIQIYDAITITGDAFQGSNTNVDLQLYAIIVHNGNNQQSGHYYTYLKPDPDGQWYCFNDSRVISLKDTDFLQNDDVLHNAYIIFYKDLSKCV